VDDRNLVKKDVIHVEFLLIMKGYFAYVVI